MYILYLLFKSKDKSHGGRGLVMLQKQQDKGKAMLLCDRGESEEKKKVGASLYAY